MKQFQDIVEHRFFDFLVVEGVSDELRESKDEDTGGIPKRISRMYESAADKVRRRIPHSGYGPTRLLRSTCGFLKGNVLQKTT